MSFYYNEVYKDCSLVKIYYEYNLCFSVHTFYFATTLSNNPTVKMPRVTSQTYAAWFTIYYTTFAS